MSKNLILVIEIRLNAIDDHFSESTAHLCDRFFSRIGMHDQLCQHRIIKCRNRIPTVNRRIDPDPFSARKMQFRNLSRRRSEVLSDPPH